MPDKVHEILLEALKQAAGDPREQRLYRSGKLAGLFPGKTGVAGVAAQQALHDGLLEVSRTEMRGKVTVEWVRPSPSGIQFVYDNETPTKTLEELRDVLRLNQDNLPNWQASIQCEFQDLSKRLSAECERWSHLLELLSRRVEEALRRNDAGAATSATPTNGGNSWTVDALAYLDRRRETGIREPCPLPELFSALRQSHGTLTMTAFHDGLRRLRDRRVLELRTFPGQAQDLPQPEYALLDGAELLYYACR